MQRYAVESSHRIAKGQTRSCGRSGSGDYFSCNQQKRQYVSIPLSGAISNTRQITPQFRRFIPYLEWRREASISTTPSLTLFSSGSSFIYVFSTLNKE